LRSCQAWLDHIVIAGKTFRYTETGATGLAGGKKVIIVQIRCRCSNERSPTQCVVVIPGSR